jgi:hypothetical protein
MQHEINLSYTFEEMVQFLESKKYLISKLNTSSGELSWAHKFNTPIPDPEMITYSNIKMKFEQEFRIHLLTVK